MTPEQQRLQRSVRAAQAAGERVTFTHVLEAVDDVSAELAGDADDLYVTLLVGRVEITEAGRIAHGILADGTTVLFPGGAILRHVAELIEARGEAVPAQRETLGKLSTGSTGVQVARHLLTR